MSPSAAMVTTPSLSPAPGAGVISNDVVVAKPAESMKIAVPVDSAVYGPPALTAAAKAWAMSSSVRTGTPTGTP